MIGIILATYEPDYSFFKEQIQSIKEQDSDAWVCYICDDASSLEKQKMIVNEVSDDKRFNVFFFEQQVGSYLNFERGLRIAQGNPSVSYIAFSDQDDVWSEQKLSSLLREIQRYKGILIHSDLELIDFKGNMICDSVWNHENRNPEKSSIELSLMRNCFTGCSMLFHRDLLPDILPFPAQKKRGDWYHDHWVALVAQYRGNVIHSRRSLVRYRSHDKNVVGAKKNTGSLYLELQELYARRFRMTFQSYRIHKDLSDAFFQRFTAKSDAILKNPFSDKNIDFGLKIFVLGIKSLVVGYGSLGIASRLIFNKIIYDFKKCLGFTVIE